MLGTLHTSTVLSLWLTALTILQILDLNAKMTNSVDIPITRHCGYKSSLTLSHSIF